MEFMYTCVTLNQIIDIIRRWIVHFAWFAWFNESHDRICVECRFEFSRFISIHNSCDILYCCRSLAHSSFVFWPASQAPPMHRNRRTHTEKIVRRNSCRVKIRQRRNGEVHLHIQMRMPLCAVCTAVNVTNVFPSCSDTFTTQKWLIAFHVMVGGASALLHTAEDRHHRSRAPTRKCVSRRRCHHF